jgi:outer membrane protein assembly factor BamE (lipoprotein component of BamABCDE complex)
MRTVFVLGLAGVLFLAGCASSGLLSDCLERQHQADRVATLAGSWLQVGLSTSEVRALLGNPVEIVRAQGMGDFEIWKYYLVQDCRAHLGEQSPHTELFFLNGNLVKWTTYVQPPGG